MLLPWVRRENIDHYRRLHREAAKRATAAEALNKHLSAQLDLAQRERADLQNKLLRVGFGLHPFEEAANYPQGVEPAPTAASQQPQDTNIPFGASPEQVQEYFVREAMEMFGPSNARAIRNYLEQRQADYYAGRINPIAPSAEELSAAQKVAADVDAAIEEGRRRAAQKE